MFRLQAYGVMWAATGTDQHYPADYERAAIDLERNEKFGELDPPTLDQDRLAFDMIDRGAQMARSAGAQVLLLNEPILVSNGKNSDVRYNFFYPRWAYDQYRAQLQARATALGVPLFDAWNLLPQAEFTNSAVHTTPAGAAALARALAGALQAAR
jgi:lysophospholipase L1-like esterase